ncbi:MAG: hypothetical protein KC583_14685 [Myxococcales bacterium]|nr:hypothetical protein [Myxococcales bacterium]
MTITLTNATRRMKVINLPHDVFCAGANRCACLPASGGKPLPSALTLASGASAEGLHEAVLRVPEVARAVRAGELRVRREAPAPEVSPPADSNPDTRSRKASRRSGRKKAR